MIENNPSNVSSGFEMLLEEVEAEIDFFTRIGSRAFESRDFRKVDEARLRQAEELLAGAFVLGDSAAERIPLITERIGVD